MTQVDGGFAGLMQVHLEEMEHPTAAQRLGMEAGSVPPGWLHRQRCRLLCRAGNWLVWWGVRLQQSGMLQAVPLHGQPSGGR
jgi:hypothetical protein